MGRAVAETIKTLAFGSVVATYTQVGNDFVNPARLLVLDSTLDAPIFVSFNGVDDNLYFRSDQQMIIDISSNASAPDDRFRLSRNEGIYIRHAGVAPGSGDFRASVFTDASYGV